MAHRTRAELCDSIEHLRAAPADQGRVHLVVRRPANKQREILTLGRLDVDEGLVGDNWLSRATSSAISEGRHLKAQLNIMSARMVAVLAATPEQQALAGDQLFIDLDISTGNLPVGARLAVGPEAIIEVDGQATQRLRKFTARFGHEAMLFVNSPVGKELRLRGFNARVIQSGDVRPGDEVQKI